jgi:hypothetical protein
MTMSVSVFFTETGIEGHLKLWVNVVVMIDSSTLESVSKSELKLHAQAWGR